MSTNVRVEKKESVTTIILSRPHAKNAVDQQTAHELAAAFRSFESDPSARVAVLWGEEGTFCAGADLKEVARGKRTENIPKVGEGDGPMGPSRFVLSKPSIAAISGHAVVCDLRVVEENAILGVFCRRFGVPLIDGGTVRLPRLIGLSHALDMILTGRPVGAEEALRMGLANRIVPQGKAREEAEKLATLIASFPQICMRNDRLSAYEQFDLSFEKALENEMERGRLSLAAETVQGASKFAGGEGRHGSFANFQKSKL